VPDLNLQQISESGKAPKTRIKDAASLNAVVQKLVEGDHFSALDRVDVQAALDGKAPFDEYWMKQTGQEGRCNLNFLDLKRNVKREERGYYDLMDSVPTLGVVNSPLGDDPINRNRWNMIQSEELHRMLKDWPSFNTYHQLLVQKFCSHGMGFLYFEDDVNWKYRVAGLTDFKVPRQTTLAEEELDIAVVFRDVTTAQLFHMVDEAAEDDKRWNREECHKAILSSQNSSLVFTPGEWEKWQDIMKNNDVWAANTAQELVKLAHCWVREYSGQISQYLTLRNGGNKDFLFKCENRFDNITQCFNFFPYEVGTNGLLHSVRGKAHELFPTTQVLNTLRCQSVDNARFAGSLLLQPKSATDAEDLAVIFYGGVVYLPPEVQVQNGKLTNPADGMLPVIQDMSFLLRDETSNAQTRAENAVEKTKFQNQREIADEALLPTTSLDLFYQGWKRHLNEIFRRVKNPKLRATDPGAKEVFAYRKRCLDRGVPPEVLIDEDSWIEPMRAVGYGSPGARLLAYDEFMNYYGELDAVGQNNLIRDRFAQKVGYAQVDRYVPQTTENRMPYDFEIAELQNTAMSAGGKVSVTPNDNNILHLQSHLPSLEEDLTMIEQGQLDAQLVHVATLKTQHCAQHMQGLKMDKLNKRTVMELGRKFNNLAERTSAAVDAFERHQQRMMEQQREAELKAAHAAGAESVEQQNAVQEAAQSAEAHQQDMRQSEEEHQQDMVHRRETAAQSMALKQANAEASAAAKRTVAKASK
jgi:hypothetical protein